MPVMKKPSEGLRSAIPAPLRALTDVFFPPDDLGMDSIAAPLMAAGRAGKGLANGIKGFALPDGKMARPVSDGTNMIIEGTDAVKALKRMEMPHARMNRESGFVPAVSHSSHLDDVRVPIADSLDTEMAAGAPTIGKWANNRDATARRSTKVNPTIVKDMRALYDTGLKVGDIHRLYPEVAQPTITDIVRRLSWAKVK